MGKKTAKGDPRPENSGRKKGTPNKRTASLLEKAEELGVDPFQILLHVASGNWKALGYEEANFVVSYTEDGNAIERERITLQDRAKAAKDVCEYLHPKRKALEHSLGEGSEQGFKVVVVDYLDKNK